MSMSFSLVRNKQEAPRPRYDQLEGREHIVVPMVMITEGVHVGSGGPLLYEANQLADNPMSWNHKPVVVYHPSIQNGNNTACSQEEINARKVGVILNTKFDSQIVNNKQIGRLPAEAWIDVKRVDNIDQRVIESIESSTPMEVSTGLFSKHENTPGVWNGEHYVAKATNLQPDHLALLPDKQGACSLADGAGLLVNEAAEAVIGSEGLFPLLQRSVGLTMQRFAANIKSHGTIYQELYEALNKKFDGGDLWIAEVYDDFAIFEHGGLHWRLGYKSPDDKTLLLDETPKQVVRVTEYRTIDGDFVANTKKEPEVSKAKKEDKMKSKKEKVDEMVANAATKFGEADVDWLMKLEDAQLDVVCNSVAETPAAPTPADDAAVQPGDNQDGSVQNATTVADYVAAAPPEIQAILNSGLSRRDDERATAIATITANSSDWTPEELADMEDSHLQRIANMAAPAKPINYQGAPGAPASLTSTHNQEALPVLTLDD